MTRKIRILAIVYAIAGVVILGGLAGTQYIRAENYRLQLNNTYRHAFSELVGDVNEISSGLQKSLYATSPSMISSTCTDVFGKAVSAQMAMGELPFDGELEKTARFISTVGDYAYTLSKYASSGGGYTEEQAENLADLASAAETLSYNLTQLLYELDNGSLTLEAVAGADDSVSGAVLYDSLKTVETEFPEIPSLIYDGPFSEHIQNMKPVYLEGMKTVSKEEAILAAAKLLEIKQSDFVYTGLREGNLPAYMFSAETENGTVYAEVTVAGGVVLEVMNPRSVGSAGISSEDAVEAARTFLNKAGYENMSESYYMTNGNVCTVNFAYTQSGVICYPDLIKVSVAMDNGEIVGFETMGYVMSHTQRNLPSAEATKEEALKKVSPRLTVLSHQMAVIPTEGKYEVYCHEFKCETESGRHYIIYVNAETGEEEKILILIESESGTLTL